MILLYAFISMFGWGIGDFFGATLARKVGVIRSLFWSYLIGLVLSSLIVIVFINSIQLSIVGAVYAIVGGFFHIVGSIMFFKGFKTSKIGIVSTITSLYSLVIVIFGVFVFKESLSESQWVAILLALVGVTVLSFDIHKLSSNLKVDFGGKGIFFSIITMFAWSTAWILFREAVRESSWILPQFVFNLLSFLVLVIYGKASKADLSLPKDKKMILLIFSDAVFTLIGLVSYSIGIMNFYTSIITPFSSSYPIVTTLLGRIFYKEKLHLLKYIGITLVIAGVIVLNL
ncbi:EamA family transporter [Candidatus Dojkabacteria bacterium]|nr:EamA family transporter [Candidatus Dojkabacteria bacterium]